MESTPAKTENQNKVLPIKELPKPSGRTLRQHIEGYVRPDGSRGLTVRELKRATHVSAPTLKLVLD